MQEVSLTDKVLLLTKIDDPAYIVLNDKVTLQLNSDGVIRMLVFAKDVNEECFIPCQVDFEKKVVTKGDRTNRIYTKGLSSYKESKRLHREVGSQMSTI